VTVKSLHALGLFVALSLTTPAVGFASSSSSGSSDSDSDTPLQRTLNLPDREIQPTYEVAAGIDGDVFPVFANFASLQKPADREWGVVAISINNNTDHLIRQRVSVRVAGWSDQEIQMVDVAAGQSRTFKFAPTFLPRLYHNHEIAAATAVVEVSDGAGRLVYDTTIPVRLRSVDDMFWGAKFKYAPFIASWVTPHDVQIEKTLALAKRLAPQHRLPGYENWKDAAQQERSTHIQAKAIYDALKRQGLSYVKSSLTFGENTGVSQRIRMPKESIGTTSMNCIDGAVMFASLFENLAMEPVIVLVPGHAYVGVRVARGSQRYLFFDTALIARVPFAEAVRSADIGLSKFGPSQITRIPIESARDMGIYPMPN
jgi:hypothetical protein